MNGLICRFDELAATSHHCVMNIGKKWNLTKHITLKILLNGPIKNIKIIHNMALCWRFHDSNNKSMGSSKALLLVIFLNVKEVLHSHAKFM